MTGWLHLCEEQQALSIFTLWCIYTIDYCVDIVEKYIVKHWRVAGNLLTPLKGVLPASRKCTCLPSRQVIVWQSAVQESELHNLTYTKCKLKVLQWVVISWQMVILAVKCLKVACTRSRCRRIYTNDCSNFRKALSQDNVSFKYRQMPASSTEAWTHKDHYGRVYSLATLMSCQ